MLKLQYFGNLMQRADSLEKTLMLGKIEGRSKRGRQRMRWLDVINIFFVDMLNLRYTVETQLYGSNSLEFAFGIYIWNYQQLDGI